MPVVAQLTRPNKVLTFWRMTIKYFVKCWAFCIFVPRNDTKYSTCSVQKSLKTRRGYCIAVLVRFATSQIPAPCLLFSHLLEKSRNMSITKHLFDQLEEQAEICVQQAIAHRKLTQQLCAEIRASIEAKQLKLPKPYRVDRSLLNFVN